MCSWICLMIDYYNLSSIIYLHLRFFDRLPSSTIIYLMILILPFVIHQTHHFISELYLWVLGCSGLTGLILIHYFYLWVPGQEQKQHRQDNTCQVNVHGPFATVWLPFIVSCIIRLNFSTNRQFLDPFVSCQNAIYVWYCMMIQYGRDVLGKHIKYPVLVPYVVNIKSIMLTVDMISWYHWYHIIVISIISYQ